MCLCRHCPWQGRHAIHAIVIMRFCFPTAQPALSQEAEESNEERARRIASQWTADTGEAAPAYEEPYDDDDDVHEEEDDEDEHAAYHDDDYARSDVVEADEETAFSASLKEHSRAVMDKNRELSRATTELQALEAELEALRSEQRGLDRYLSLTDAPFDFGPGDVLLPLAQRCLVDAAGAFHYEVCMFDRASQFVKYRTQHKTSLGQWAGFEEGHSVAVFAGGEECGALAPRSMRVYIRCGVAESLTVTEPVTCQYEGVLTTPLVCSSTALHEAQVSRPELVAYVLELRCTSPGRPAPRSRFRLDRSGHSTTRHGLKETGVRAPRLPLPFRNLALRALIQILISTLRFALLVSRLSWMRCLHRGNAWRPVWRRSRRRG